MEHSAVEAKVMRAICARERRRALEQRAADAPAIAIAAGAGWSAKPARATRADKVKAARQAKAWDEARRRFAERQPAAAAAERAIRKANADISAKWGENGHATPATREAASRVNQGALARLYQRGAIDADQLASAVAIAQVAERIGGAVAVRTASLETRVDSQRAGDGTFFEKLGEVRAEIAYTRWRAAVPGPIAPVLEMLVGEPAGFSVVAARYGMHHRRAKRLLIAALDLWPAMIGAARREVDEATLAAAQAGIL